MSHPVHLLENLALLAADAEAHLGAELRELRPKPVEGLPGRGAVHDHHHVEVVLHDSLADVQDVYVGLVEVHGRLCDDAHDVLANDCDYYLLHR